MEPPPPAETTLRRKRWWRWPRRIAGLLIGLLFILLVVLYLGRNRLVAPFVLDCAASAAGEALGGEFSVEELGGSWFGGLEIRGIRTGRAGTATPLRTIELDELVAEYSLWDWLTGKPGWFRSLRGHGLRVAVDLRQGLSAEPREEDEPAAPFEAPPWLPAVEISGLELVLDGEELHLEVPAASLSVSLQAPGRHRLVLDAELNQLAARGQRIDDARLRIEADWLAGELQLPHLEAVLDHGEEQLRVTGSLDRERLAAVVKGRKLGIGPYAAAAGQVLALTLDLQAELSLPLADPAAVEAELTLTGTSFAGFGFDLDRIESHLVVAGGQLRDGWLELVAPEGSARLTGLSLPLDPSLPIAELARRAEFEFELRSPRLPALLARQGVSLEGLPAVAEELTLVGGKRGDELRFDQAGVSGPDGGLSFDGLRLQLGGGVPEQVRIALENLVLETPAGTLALEAELPLALSAEPLLAEGELMARGSLTGFDLERFRPLLGEIELPVERGLADLTWELGGTWQDPVLRFTVDGRDWLLAPSGTAVPAGPFRFGMEATYAGGKAELSQGRLQGAGLDASWSGEMALPLDLRALAAGDRPALDGTFRAEAEITSDDLGWIAELAPELRPAARSGRLAVSVEGTLEDPVATLVAQVEDLVLGAEPGPPLRLELRARHAGGVLEIQECRAEADGLALAASGRLPLAADPGRPLADGPVELQIEIERLELAGAAALAAPFAELPPAEGSLSASLALGGSWNALEIDGELHGRELRLDLPEAELPLESAELDARFGWADGSATLSQLRLRSELAELDADGTMALALDPRALLAGRRPEPGPLAGRAELRVPDLAWTAALPQIQRAGGAALARIGFSGTIDALDFGGEIQLDDATLRLARPGLAALTALDLRGRFDQETVTIESLSGELGAEPFEASGTVRYAGVPEPEFDLAFRGKDLLLYRAQGVKLRANARLKINGPLSQAVASGKVKITDGKLVKKVDFLRLPVGAPAPPSPDGIQLFSLAPPFDKLRFEVEISSKKGIHLHNNIARGLLRPELELTGTGAVPVLLGKIYLDEMVMDLPATRLELEPSVVSFLHNDPFRPRLNIRGRMRRYGYDVEMNLSGPYDQPEVLFSSVPPLRQEELLLLVSTGQPPAERIDAEGAMSSVAIYLARDFLKTFFGDESTEAKESVLDRLEIYTGRDNTRQGEETIEGRFRMFDQFLFDDDSLYLESKRDSYGDFNIGLKLLIRFP